MGSPPYDPRSVANSILEIGGRYNLSITNLGLQKILYFSHGYYLLKTKTPLVSGVFEAWTYGPVHSAVYNSFKSQGRLPITIRAEGTNVITGEKYQLAPLNDAVALECLERVVTACQHLTPSQLIEISHAPKGPWSYVVNKAKTSVVLGYRIPDNVTLERFRYQMIPIMDAREDSDLDDDKPLAGNRLS